MEYPIFATPEMIPGGKQAAFNRRVAPVLQKMEADRHNPEVQKEGCERLYDLVDLSSSPENKGISQNGIVEMGGIAAIVVAMNEHPLNFEVQQSGFLALFYLADDNAENQKMVADESDAISHAQSNHSDNKSFVRHCQEFVEMLRNDEGIYDSATLPSEGTCFLQTFILSCATCCPHEPGCHVDGNYNSVRVFTMLLCAHDNNTTQAFC